MRVDLIAEGRGKKIMPTSIMMTPTYCSLESGCSRVTVYLRNVSARSLFQLNQPYVKSSRLLFYHQSSILMWGSINKKIVPVRNYPCLPVMIMGNGFNRRGEESFE